jgi:spermidine synthase
MNNTSSAYLSLFLLSASMLCFEIVSTRIASVIFVQDYAFITLSLALLGIGGGGVFSYYKIKAAAGPSRLVYRALFALGLLLCIFITAIIELSITSPVVFLLFVVLPFFASGVIYAQIYKTYPTSSSRLYASDLSGAAVGSVASLGLIGVFGAPNSIIFVALVVFTLFAFSLHPLITSRKRVSVYSILAISFAVLIFNGRNEFLGMVPIGNFPDKDFYHVYPDASTSSTIIDSRWSIYGRSDLVQYSHQDMVRQLFVDGAAGTQVYRFNGNIQNTQSILQELLLHHTNAIPFLCLNRGEKRSMLVIGPGGGKEVLLGLFGEADTITGVEVNPDFVKIVKEHKGFDGGIYSDFSNVNIIVEEGRHYVKQSHGVFDLLVMALPSTAQMQNIEPFATSENYLLTKEAIEDYLKKLTSEGRMIFTVHNEWELMRLIATSASVFQDMGVPTDEIKNHFVVFEAEYAPTVVIKKNAFTLDETQRWRKTCMTLPRGLPTVTYLPCGMTDSSKSQLNQFLVGASQSPERLRTYIRRSGYDISPCTDDRPYFYKIFRGIPDEYLWLLVGTVGFNLLVVWFPSRFIRRKAVDKSSPKVFVPLMILICTGIGFMVLEVTLFQKLVLYLGSPTISLSILLSSLLVGMGTGSYVGGNMFGPDVRKRLYVVSIAIVVVGILLFVVSPAILVRSLEFELPLRAATSFLVVLPLAFFLGIPFPSCIQLLTLGRNDRYIPWMYGVNGSMSVLGSVLAVVLSMLFGFTPAYFVGLVFYLGIFVISFLSSKTVNPGSVTA